jgi:hypothetical protein
MIKSYYKVYRVFPDPEYVWVKNEKTSVVQFSTTNYMNSPINLEYSLDKTTWNNYDMSNKPTVIVPAGGYIYLRGVNTGVTFNSDLHFGFSFEDFGISQPFSTGGDIRTLLNYQDVNSVTKIPDYAFYDVFRSGGNITSCTWDMSGITEVGANGFDSCFDGCSNLTTAPDFSNVTSIGAKGFNACFNGCSNLTTTPDFSNVTSIEYASFNYCFTQCSSLTIPPDFSKITGAKFTSFNSCFYKCIKLTTAPDFSNITSLEGGSTFLSCFKGCSSLNLVTAPNITTWDNNYFTDWLVNVASSGVVRKPAKLTIPTDSTSGVPTGWTTENY